jgi:hypothetical protein
MLERGVVEKGALRLLAQVPLNGYRSLGRPYRPYRIFTVRRAVGALIAIAALTIIFVNVRYLSGPLNR